MQLMITSGVEFPASQLQAIFEAGKSIKVSSHHTCMFACSPVTIQHAAASQHALAELIAGIVR